MSSGTIIIGAIAVLVCIIPLYLFGRKRGRKKQQLKKHLLTLAAENQCNISDHESWNDFIIGIDQEKKVLFYLKNNEKQEEKHIFRIQEIQKVRSSSFSVQSEGNKSESSITDKAGITLTLTSAEKAEVFLEFYSSETGNFTVGPELQMAEKWVKIIKDTMVSRHGKSTK